MTLNATAEWWRPPAVVGAADATGTAAPAEDSAAPFAALLVLTSIVLLAPQQILVRGLAHVHIALIAGAFAVVAHCWTRFAARRPIMRFTREIWLAAVLLGWAGTTLPLSEWTGGSVSILVDLYFKSLIVFWLLTNTVTTLGRLRAIAWALSLMAAPLAATGVRNFLSHHLVTGRIIGYDAPLTENPGDLALMLNLILPLTVAIFLLNRRPAIRVLLAGLIALDVSGIIVTFARAGFLTLATTFILYLGVFRRRRKWGWAVVALALAVMAVPLLPSGYLGRLATITDINADQTHSAQERWGDTQTALAFMLSHPVVGAGLGMNVLALDRMDQATGQQVHNVYVHNVYLEYAMDLGWPGLGLFLLLLVSCVRSAERVRDRSAGVPALRELSVLAEAIRITLVAFAVAGLFYPVAYHVFFYYFAALAIAAGAVYEAETRGEAGAPRMIAAAWQPAADTGT